MNPSRNDAGLAIVGPREQIARPEEKTMYHVSGILKSGERKGETITQEIEVNHPQGMPVDMIEAQLWAQRLQLGAIVVFDKLAGMSKFYNLSLFDEITIEEKAIQLASGLV